ncbi:HAD family hydrolase [Sulfitobacter sp. LCG007]
MRIAMWSGPRNLSTAMMYSFGARSDFHVMDEPFYGAFLARTGIDHPMRTEILAVHENNPAQVAESFATELAGRPHLYMKHMAHHMLDGFPLGWAEGCVNVHLIRHPARVIASYAAKREHPTLTDIGFEQQARIHATLGGLIVDSADIRADPERMLRLLCDRIGIAFDASMLNWPAGPRAADGVWAAHWYGAVHRSTRFAGPEGALPELTGEHADLLDQAMPHYRSMWDRRLT